MDENLTVLAILEVSFFGLWSLIHVMVDLVHMREFNVRSDLFLLLQPRPRAL